MDRCPANYSLLAWLPGDAASRIFLVSTVKLLLLRAIDQLDPEAMGLPGPTHSWVLTQSNTNDPTNCLFFSGGGVGGGKRVFNNKRWHFIGYQTDTQCMVPVIKSCSIQSTSHRGFSEYYVSTHARRAKHLQFFHQHWRNEPLVLVVWFPEHQRRYQYCPCCQAELLAASSQTWTRTLLHICPWSVL